jgi:thiamine biosynthesis protein ThiC
VTLDAVKLKPLLYQSIGASPAFLLDALHTDISIAYERILELVGAALRMQAST